MRTSRAQPRTGGAGGFPHPPALGAEVPGARYHRTSDGGRCDSTSYAQKARRPPRCRAFRRLRYQRTSFRKLGCAFAKAVVAYALLRAGANGLSVTGTTHPVGNHMSGAPIEPRAGAFRLSPVRERSWVRVPPAQAVAQLAER